MLLDSTADALEMQRRVWQRIGPEGRVRMAIEMSEEARRVTLAGIEAQYPGITPDEARRILIERCYGVDPFNPPPGR